MQDGTHEFHANDTSKGQKETSDDNDEAVKQFQDHRSLSQFLKKLVGVVDSPNSRSTSS